jgi:peptidyl-prolyl cis-trans isomerase C
MQRTAFVVAFSLASSIAMAQNVAVVNGKPISKAREDAWVKELTKQGQQDSPELRKQVKERLIQKMKFCFRKRRSAA